MEPDGSSLCVRTSPTLGSVMSQFIPLPIFTPYLLEASTGIITSQSAFVAATLFLPFSYSGRYISHYLCLLHVRFI